VTSLSLVAPVVCFFFSLSFSRCSLSNHYHRPLLTCARPERHSIKSCLSSLKWWGPALLPYRLLLSVRLVFRFGGDRSLHKVQSLILCSPLDVKFARFTTSILIVLPKTLLPFPILTSRGWCLLCPPIRLAVFLRFLSCTCSSTPRLLMPLLYSGSCWRLLPNVRPLWISCTTLALVHSFPTMFLLRHANFARWDTFLRATASSFRDHDFPGPETSWRVFFFGMPILHGETPSCRRQPTSSWIYHFPGSFPSASGGAPLSDSGPYASSTVLRPASLQPLPLGFPAASLQMQFPPDSPWNSWPPSFQDGPFILSWWASNMAIIYFWLASNLASILASAACLASILALNFANISNICYVSIM
jgi:hypothetical protein